MNTTTAKRMYHFGVVEGAPFHSLTLGGVTFTKRTARVRQDEHGDTVRDWVDGHYARMEPEQAERARAAARRHFVRVGRVGEDGAREGSAAPTVFQFNAKGRRFNQLKPGDEPVTKWLYLEEVERSAHAPQHHATMAELDGSPIEAQAAPVLSGPKTMAQAQAQADEAAQVDREMGRDADPDVDELPAPTRAPRRRRS